MNAPPETPERLVHVATGRGNPIEVRAGELLRVLQALPPRLPPSARARIIARLDERAATHAQAPRRAHWPAAVAAAFVLAFGVFVGGVVGASWGLAPARRWVGRFLLSGAPTTSTEPARRVAQAPAPETLTAPMQDKQDTNDAPDTNVAPRRPRLTHAARTHEAAPAATPSEDPVVAESRLLASALQDLRQHRDPQAALGVLDEYERRFPSGALAPEATAARIDALLALGRRAQALQRLEASSLDRLPRGAELRALRGELRAGRGELGGALDDFSVVLATKGAPAGVVERALYGRGSCRARLGDVAGARADLGEYLRRFPSGSFAEPARRALRD